MKRFLLFITAAIMMAMGNAQNFDETQLIGKWHVTSANGNWNNTIASIEDIVFGDIIYDCYEGYKIYKAYSPGYIAHVTHYDCWDEEERHDDTIDLWDFFISNGNKLHLIVEESVSNLSIRLIIKELSDNSMTLESFDGKSQFVLAKETTKAPSVTVNTKVQTPNIYDMKGRQVRHTHKNSIYIQDNKTVMK